LSTIYVAIPCLEDLEIFETLKDIYTLAKNPQNIHVGVAAICSKKLFKKIKKLKYPNFSIGYFSPEDKNNLGVGKGRKFSYSFYNDEDYFLQIDSHTMFDKNWDEMLINMYEDAKVKNNLENFILTSGVPSYCYTGFPQRRKKFTNKSEYHTFYNKEYHPFGEKFIVNLIPKWNDSYLEEYPEEYRLKDFTKSFYPSLKFCAAFAFGTKNFAKNNGLEESSIFWEEEIFQTINLLDLGIALVYPYPTIPLYHLQAKHQKRGKERKNLSNYLGPGSNRYLWDVISENYLKYINDPNNKNKIDYFEKYSNIDVRLGPKKPFYIPESYYVDRNVIL
jgi:hypothetical protein